MTTSLATLTTLASRAISFRRPPLAVSHHANLADLAVVTRFAKDVTHINEDSRTESSQESYVTTRRGLSDGWKRRGAKTRVPRGRIGHHGRRVHSSLLHVVRHFAKQALPPRVLPVPREPEHASPGPSRRGVGGPSRSPRHRAPLADSPVTRPDEVASTRALQKITRANPPSGKSEIRLRAPMESATCPWWSIAAESRRGQPGATIEATTSQQCG